MLRYLVNKEEQDSSNSNNHDNAASSQPPSTSSETTMTKPSPERHRNARKPKTVQMWACDLCQTTYPDFDDACRCEDQCRLKNATTGNSSSSDVDGKGRDQSLSQQVWSCDVCHQTQFTDYDEACRHEEQCRSEQEQQRRGELQPQAKPEAEAALSIVPTTNDKQDMTTSKVVHHRSHPFFGMEQTTKPKRKKRSKRTAPRNGDADTGEAPLLVATKLKKQKTSTRNRPVEPTKMEGSTNYKKRSSGKTQAAPAAHVADIFASNGKGALQIMAEHRAAEFAAKRRKHAEQERERQKRRQQAKLQIQASKHKGSSEQLHHATRTGTNKSSFVVPLEVRFPVPSHVTGQVPNKSEQQLPATLDAAADMSYKWIDQDALSEAQGRLERTARHQGSTPPSTASSTQNVKDCTTATSLLPVVSATTATNTTMMDPLQKALADLLVPPERPSVDIVSSTETWCDKYAIQSIPDDICGAHNKETAGELVNFVNEWKVERHRAHERRAERQRALQKSNKKKRKTKYIDDDLWDDFSDEEDVGLCSVCLLTGPTGSGKTNLVHAVAKQSDCKVLEINTTERRGGQALKHAIEEATQSDSSLDMLKQTKDTLNETEPLVDSDEEMEEAETKGSSIVLILIDEVDIMFEDAGDSGFWSAMNTLTKRAKCPIFLTANFIPDALASSTIRYLHLETVSPTPEECASQMRRIVKNEGLSRTERFADRSAADKQLSRIALLCKCDLRRVINELQLFATSPTLSMKNDDSPMEPDLSSKAPASGKELVFPFIVDISPKKVSPHDLSLLTIKGKHFNLPTTTDRATTSVHVHFGNQASPAVQVMDDATILAVCPPCSPPLGVTDAGVIEQSGVESRTSRFAPASIRVFVRDSLMSRSDSIAYATTQLCDGTSSTLLGRKWNIEYAFPPPRYGILSSRVADRDVESSDFESGCDETTMLEAGMAPTSPRKRRFTLEDAALILERGAREWKARHSESNGRDEPGRTCCTVNMQDVESAKELVAISSLSELASDAAVFEDAFEFGGIPFLAGVVPGFGSSLVNEPGSCSSDGNERKLLRDANARPPSFDRLFSLGWNDDGCFFGSCDAYMQDPTSSNEKMLLARCQSLERGLSHPLSTATVSCDANQEESHHDEHASDSLAETIKLHERPHFVPEEDLFIRRHNSSSICSLPNDLRRHVREAGLDGIEQGDLVCLTNVIDKKVGLLAGLSSNVFEDDPQTIRLLCDTERVNEISIVPIPSRMKDHLFLDYVPMLCSISMHERAAEHAFQQVLRSDPETAAAMAGRRRMTRRAGKSLEREHYFVTMRSCRENSVANDIGSELAKEMLHYCSTEQTR